MLAGLMNAFRNYATFDGRATRREFWSFTLLFAVTTIGAHYLDAMDGETASIAAGMGILELSIFLLLLLPALTSGARRLHDTGRSGWWLCTMYIPYLGFIVTVDNPSLRIAAAAALLTGTLLLLIQLCLPGEKGENRFGPNPRGVV
jgi:uncharacterized membrane protein YhaH (DUF805 family)